MGIFTFNNLLSAVKMNGLSESFLLPMILNMSITASVIILFVLLARLMLKKAPKIFSYALWAVVLFRLLCPVSIPADFSLLGLFDTPVVKNTQHTTAMEYVPYDVVHTPDLEVQLPVPPAINNAVNSTLPQEHAALGADPLEGEIAIASFLWMIGIAAMVVYSTSSYILLRRKLVGAVPLRGNIYLADYIQSPFVMGLFRPKIYLPAALSEQEQAYIILHEQYHIRRGDHLIKALAFIALCIHWFNPLVWVAFVLSSKDMEMSCDEAVVKKLGEGIRADYSASLLSLATGRRIIAGTPLAFGEGDTKSRIKNMLNWKKPKTWIVLVALVACVIAIVFCATNPRNDAEEPNGMITWEVDAEYPETVMDIINDYVMQQVEYYNDLGSDETAIGGEYSILEVKVIGLTKMVATGFADAKQSVELYRLEYRLLPSEPNHVMLAGGMQMDGDWIAEWGSVGQPYFALLCDWSSGEEVWTKIGVTNTDVIDHEYSTTEMLAQYNDKYDAAAMELYKEYLNEEGQGSYGTAEDVSYYLELAADTEFKNMSLERQTSILVEYEDLLDDYTLIARETKDGKTAYIVGQYNGDPGESPLYRMYATEVSMGEDDFFQFLYREENAGTVDAVLAANQNEFPPSAGYRIEDSCISWSSDSGMILIQPKENQLPLDVPWNRCLFTPNGREYIEDAVSRGIDVCGRTDTFLYVYLISERFGEVAERIALTEAEAQAILAEERVSITDGFGFSASLHIDGQTTYYNEREGIPQTVLDLAVEKCDYRFGDPGYITDTIREARLDCDWLDAPLYAGEEDLPRLREILKNAEHGYVGSCGYGAKLTLTFIGGEKLTVFKGCDGCDTVVFGSYGGYFIGDKENTEFWAMFGLDADTKDPIETVERYAFSDVLGYSGYMITDGGKPWEMRTYYAVVGNEEHPIAESFGFGEAQDYVVDLDGDGITELVANVTYGGDGARRVHVFQRRGNTIYIGTLSAEGLPDFNNWGANAFWSEYDDTSGVFRLHYAQKGGNDEAVLETKGLENLQFDVFQPASSTAHIPSPGETRNFTYQGLQLEVSNVLSSRQESILAEGIEPHEYTVFTCGPGAVITILDAGMNDLGAYEDGKPHPRWGLSYTNETERTRITEGTKTVSVTSELEGVYNLEASLFVLQVELID